MAIVRGEGIQITQEEAKEFGFEEPKSLLRSAAEFIAPTTTGVITGEKEITPRTIAGTALEVGALAIPSARVAGIGARFAPRLFGAGVEKTIAPVAEQGITSFTRKFGQGAGRLFGKAKAAALPGGISGAMLGAGQVLGKEELDSRDVLGQAVQFGAVGAVSAGLLAPSLSALGGITKGTTKFVSQKIKNLYSVMNPQSKQVAIDSLEDAYYNAFVADNPKVITKMEMIFGDDIRQGIRELAENGYIPRIEGKIARMKSVKDALTEIISETGGSLDSYLQNFRRKINIEQISKIASEKLKGRTDVDLIKSKRDLNHFIVALKEKYGSSLGATTIRKIEIEAGKRSRAFARTDKFVQDAANAVSQATDDVLQSIGGNQYKIFKTELQSLIRMRQTASILNNTEAKVGFLGEAMGRFLGTVGGASAGLQVAGPGGLVVAGILANLGSKSVAQIIRLSRFNPQFQKIIQNGLSHDRKILQRMIAGATPEDAALIKKTAGFSKFVNVLKKTAKQERKRIFKSTLSNEE